MSTVIKVENISKLYRLGSVGSGSLKDDVTRWWQRLRHRDDPLLLAGDVNDRTVKSQSDYVWALKDINFDVQQGDVLGIIGRNGAGKSTLLKILSKTTAPTTGRVKLNGRIASLLEVGTGFHPELTGRENIYLNGAILGMRKYEITRKLDEIIDFAGVERYIDTPVKRYSSGMYVRLAFGVAAHLESEILIIDEVLAVGDADFQKKCLGKMSEVSKGEGRTVMFVSHNIEAIKALCNKGILLENGKVKQSGSIRDCISVYNKLEVKGSSGHMYASQDYSLKSKELYIKSACLFIDGEPNNIYSNGSDFAVEVCVESKGTYKYSIELLIRDSNNIPIMFIPAGLLLNANEFIQANCANKNRIQIKLPYMAKGTYYVDVIIAETGIRYYDYIENALEFQIESNYLESSGWNFLQSTGQGSILIKEIKYTQHDNI